MSESPRTKIRIPFPVFGCSKLKLEYRYKVLYTLLTIKSNLKYIEIKMVQRKFYDKEIKVKSVLLS